MRGLFCGRKKGRQTRTAIPTSTTKYLVLVLPLPYTYIYIYIYTSRVIGACPATTDCIALWRWVNMRTTKYIPVYTNEYTDYRTPEIDLDHRWILRWIESKWINSRKTSSAYDYASYCFRIYKEIDTPGSVVLLAVVLVVSVVWIIVVVFNSSSSSSSSSSSI